MEFVDGIGSPAARNTTTRTSEPMTHRLREMYSSFLQKWCTFSLASTCVSMSTFSIRARLCQDAEKFPPAIYSHYIERDRRKAFLYSRNAPIDDRSVTACMCVCVRQPIYIQLYSSGRILCLRFMTISAQCRVYWECEKLAKRRDDR